MNSFYDAIFHGLLGKENGRRALFMFMVDQSEAMAEPWGRHRRSKLDGTVAGLNRMLIDMCRCYQHAAELAAAREGSFRRGGSRHLSRVSAPAYRERSRPPRISTGLLERTDDDRADLIDVGFIGYSDGSAGNGDGSLWVDEPEPDQFGFVRSVATLSMDRQRQMLDAVLEGGRPLPEVLARVNESVQNWVDRHRLRSIPPIVINISSGAKPLDDRAADELICIREQGYGHEKDGDLSQVPDQPLLFFNCVLLNHKGLAPLLFPGMKELSGANITDDKMVDMEYIRSLHLASSPMPEVIKHYARKASKNLPHKVSFNSPTGFAFAKNIEGLDWFGRICN